MRGISERNPYVGPRPIQQGEPLYGRSTEVSELYHRLQARRIVVLHSPSGAGKSSLVQAGLIPRLKEGKFDVWKPIRVNLDPQGLAGVPAGTNRYLLSAMVSLEEELPAERRRSPADLAALDLLAYLESRPRRKGREGYPAVLLFDQFEEVLSVAPRAVEQKRDFFDALGRALDTEKFWALFIIREDYLAAFAPYRDRVPTQMSNTFRLDLLGLEGAREAAERPALAGGRSFSAVDQLIRDLSTVQVQQADGSFVAEQGLHVEPVQLQVVCRRLWDAMPEDALSIDAEHIEQYAGVSTALGGYYAQAVETLAQGDLAVERTVREWVGQKLIVGGIRSQVRQEPGRSAGLDNTLVDELLKSYLVRTEQRAGSNWFELSHDRLVEPVLLDNKAWEEKHLHPLQAQAKQWESARRAPELLLRPEAVAEAMEWAAKNAGLVTEGEKEFLEESQKQKLRGQEKAARKRLGVLATLAVVVAAIVGVLGVVAWMQRREAVAQTARAQTAFRMAGARELVAHGQTVAASMVLAEVKEPADVRGWPQLAMDMLAQGIARSTLPHDAEVHAAAWSPDGTRIVTASKDRTARVWNADGKGDPTILAGHEGEVDAAAWSPDGTRIVTASKDRTARIWNADGKGQPVILKGHEDEVTSAAWSPDGTRIVTASRDRTARVWRADGTTPPVVLRGHEGEVRSATWSPDGTRIATASADGTALVWSANGKSQPLPLKGHEGEVQSAAWSPDGTRLVTASKDATARVWSASGTQIAVLKGHEDKVWSAAWSPDGTRIVTASEDKTARVWNADGTGHPVTFLGHEDPVRSAGWSPDGKRIFTASRDRTARVWNADGTGEPLVLMGHTDGIRSAAWSPDGKRLATVSDDDTTRVWNADVGGAPTVLEGHKGYVYAAGWSPDGKHVFTASKDRTVRLWNADGKGEPLVLEGLVEPAAWSPDGTRIVTVSADKIAQVWNADGKGDPIVLKGHEDSVWSAAWSHDGTRIVTTSADTTARVWSPEGTCTAVLRGHKGGVDAAAWSPDGKHVVTASRDGTARVWNADGSLAVTLAGHEGEVRSAAWSPDGTRIVTVSADKTARVWSLEGTCTAVLRGEGEGRSAAWSRDGKHILTAFLDRTVRVWNADGSGTPVILRGHEGEVRSAAWSPDGKHIVTASKDKTARVWSADGKGDPIVLKGHEDRVWSAAWSPDGKRIVTASEDRTARIWLLPDVPALQRALRDATTDCLPPYQRHTYLLETEPEARDAYERCERRHDRTPRAAGAPKP